MRARFLFVLDLGLCCWTLTAQAFEPKPDDSYFARFKPMEAPAPTGLALRKGDRLAICGDSITEQKMYSRIIETYLTACVPELEITVRQYGWSGERAPGFLARLTNDCLRFRPTIATTCYGMNDHEYRRFEDRIGRTYRGSSTAIVQAFKAHGARVILGSPGCVGRNPPWSQAKEATTEDLNLNLCQLRNLGIEIAAQEKVGFADVFWPMLVAGFEAQEKYGADYAVPGKDGVHPGWAGHVIMAYAFLKAFGLDGDLGTFTVDLAQGKAQASEGHEIVTFKEGELKITSRRYPFCTAAGDLTKDRRVTMIHAQFTRKDQLDKYVQYKIVPSFYTLHTYYFAEAHIANRGKEQAAYISPVRDAIDQGLRITNHTDFVVAPLDQLFMMWTAVNRISRAGAEIGPGQRITPLEALKAQTINVAYQYGEQDSKGSLEVGKLADLVILDKNPLKVDPMAIKDVKVVETIKEGKTIYARK